jgi:ribonuclease HI
MLYLYCDGAIEPKNPGGHAVGGWVLKAADDKTVLARGARSYGSAPDVTNNVAEYGAVHTGLQQVLKKYDQLRDQLDRLVVRSDSQLIIKQLQNEFACRNPVLRRMRDEIFILLEEFLNFVEFEWVPREANTDADAASRLLYAEGETAIAVVHWIITDKRG